LKRLQIKYLFFLAIALASIGFGIFKQVKTAACSLGEMTAPKIQPGSDAAAIKRAFLNVRKFEAARDEIISYQSQGDKPGQRPDFEYYYDAQYGFAPLVLTNRPAASSYRVIEFLSQDAKDRYLKEHDLRPLVSEGLWVVAAAGDH
jgi:hypothetical protein